MFADRRPEERLIVISAIFYLIVTIFVIFILLLPKYLPFLPKILEGAFWISPSFAILLLLANGGLIAMKKWGRFFHLLIVWPFSLACLWDFNLVLPFKYLCTDGCGAIKVSLLDKFLFALGPVLLLAAIVSTGILFLPKIKHCFNP